MAYTDHYKLADDLIDHLDEVIGGISDSFITTRYVGFVAVSCVTVYELAIKDIFSNFARDKHEILGNFVEKHFGRINGQIQYDQILGKHLPLFGNMYCENFKQRVSNLEISTLNSDGISIKTTYANLIGWRHQFAHVGQIPSTATYQEVVQSYHIGKQVIACLDEVMS